MARAAGVKRSFLCVLHHVDYGTETGEVIMETAAKAYASPEVPFYTE